MLKLHNDSTDWARQQMRWDSSIHSIFIRELQEAEVTFSLINYRTDIAEWVSAMGTQHWVKVVQSSMYVWSQKGYALFLVQMVTCPGP